ncbi:MAG: DUF192 domain-containing protein [Bdellovibrionaceae bacterium]|nr:DUF192 domain-containing protein [Pseudobdellovibrionaceae bacterium]
MRFWIGLISIVLTSTFAHAEIKFPKEKIKLGGKTITVEVARSNEQLAHGLMYRTQMGENDGMIFIFPDVDTRSFWMKNTFIPLSIGFFDEDKILVDIQDMEAVKSEMVTTPPSYVSAKPAKYALEMNRGWFLKNSIKVGAKFEGLSDTKTPRKRP